MEKAKNKSGALMVALGILLSRLAGLIRERVFAHYFGNSDAGDAFKAALKIPNFLQNLFGEGVLSASFIPVYAASLAQKNEEDASEVASVIGSLLFVSTSVLVVVGTLATPWMIDLIAPGFVGAKRDLCIHIVQVLFPGTGFLVMSAWCLGILNSHRRFFLSYVAPVVWNLSLIFGLIFYGGSSAQENLAIVAAWSLFVGSFLQFIVQLPTALRLAKKLRPNFRIRSEPVKVVLRNFSPVVVSRGVVQVSAYIDNMLASLLPTGAVSALAYAQTLYLLPVSLFGMSVSVAELPAMSSAVGTSEEINSYLRERLARATRQVAFFVIPSAAAFLFLGDSIVGAIFQTGSFVERDTHLVWFVLAGSAVGLLASTVGRLYSSTFYSLRDTRTPLKFALVRVFFTTCLGYAGAMWAPKLFAVEQIWGTVGLTVTAGLAGWIEFSLLRRSLQRKIGQVQLHFRFQMQVWFCALLSAAFGYLCKEKLFIFSYVILKAVAVLGVYGSMFFIIAYLLKIPEATQTVERLRRYLS